MTPPGSGGRPDATPLQEIIGKVIVPALLERLLAQHDIQIAPSQQPAPAPQHVEFRPTA